MRILCLPTHRAVSGVVFYSFCDAYMEGKIKTKERSISIKKMANVWLNSRPMQAYIHSPGLMIKVLSQLVCLS